MRIVVFVGSPIQADEPELVKLAKRLKKEKVNADIISFGDHVGNTELLTAFINALNGKDGTGSHLLNVPRGSALSEALITSPIIQGEDGQGGAGLGGAGFEFGVDPNEDPELALALRVSMEEQRQRQEDEQRRAMAESGGGAAAGADGASATSAGASGSSGSGAAAAGASAAGGSASSGVALASAAAGGADVSIDDPNTEEAMLQRALALSTETPVKRNRVRERGFSLFYSIVCVCSSLCVS